MSIEECAHVAAAWFPARETAITMVAIAGAESGYNPRAAGDDLSIFSPTLQVRYTPYACNGKLSHGYWQVFLGVHHDMIASMSGLTAPCDQADWLYDPDNCARAAAAVYANQGFTAWSAFDGQQYLAWLSQAREAVDQVLLAASDTPPAPPRTTSSLPQLLRQTADDLRKIADELDT